MPKYGGLEEITTIADADELAIKDVSVPKTKRISLAALRAYYQTIAGWITTAMLAVSAATTPKVKLNTINSRAAGGFTVQGARYTTSSTAVATIPGCTMNYTSGNTAERLILKMEVMAMSTSSNSEITLYVDNTQYLPRIYVDPSASWVRHGQTYVVDVPANTTVALSIRGFCAVNTTQLHVTNETANWMPSLTGFAMSNA